MAGIAVVLGKDVSARLEEIMATAFDIYGSRGDLFCEGNRTEKMT